jgi:hypothetical protein
LLISKKNHRLSFSPALTARQAEAGIYAFRLGIILIIITLNYSMKLKNNKKNKILSQIFCLPKFTIVSFGRQIKLKISQKAEFYPEIKKSRRENGGIFYFLIFYFLDPRSGRG